MCPAASVEEGYPALDTRFAGKIGKEQDAPECPLAGGGTDPCRRTGFFTFTDLPPRQQRRARTTNAIERLRQIVLPPADTAGMLLLALLAFGQGSTRCLAKGRQSSPISRLTSPPDPVASVAIFISSINDEHQVGYEGFRAVLSRDGARPG